MNSIILNLSGHALCSETESILNKNYDQIINVTPFDIDFDKDIESQIEKIVSEIPCKLDGSISLSVIPPGQSTISILLISYLHGLTGHFPKICYLEMNDKGLYIPKVEYEINTQKIRTAGRKFRKIIFKA